MCIIVIQPEGHVFDDVAIADFYERNPHGFGFMWADERGVNAVRGVPQDADEAIAWYQEYAAGVAGVLHFRYATSGPVNTEMAHPFAVSQDLYVVHNGVLPGGTQTESDTARFVREELVPVLGADYRRLASEAARLEALVRGSAVVFLDREGGVTRLGNEGVEYDGCWYSNTYAWTLPPELDPWANDPWAGDPLAEIPSYEDEDAAWRVRGKR